MPRALHEIQSIEQADEMIADIRRQKALGYIYTAPDKRRYERVANTSRFISESWHGYHGPVGVYVHVPWCTKKPPTDEQLALLGNVSTGRDHLCSYCNLYTAVGKGVPSWYAQTVAKEVELYKPMLTGQLSPQSLYFGGGSPSLLSVDDMAEMISAIEATVGNVDFEYERAIEVIPDSVDMQKLADMRRLFNRISVGVQTFDPQVLRSTGRNYPAEDGLRVIKEAIAAGYDDVNGDLIAGLQGSTEESFMRDVRTMLESGATTVTIYPHMLRPGTRAGKLAMLNQLDYLPQEVVTNLIHESDEMLQRAGYSRLSLTCWSKNRGYQQGEQIYERIPIIGFGAGARSYGPYGHYSQPYTEDVRLINSATDRWRKSIDAGTFPEINGIAMTADISRRADVILGLMSQKGVSQSMLQREFPHQMQSLLRAGLIEIQEDTVCYTEEGRSHSGALSQLFFSEEDLKVLQSKDSVRTH